MTTIELVGAGVAIGWIVLAILFMYGDWKDVKDGVPADP